MFLHLTMDGFPMQRFPRLTVSTAIALLTLIPSEASASLTPETPFNLRTRRVEHSSTALPLTLARNVSLSSDPLLAQSAAVPITGVADAIAKFNVAQQLYIQGNTLTPEQINRLLTTLNANPNVFVVVMDYSADVFADDSVRHGCAVSPRAGVESPARDPATHAGRHLVGGPRGGVPADRGSSTVARQGAGAVGIRVGHRGDRLRRLDLDQPPVADDACRNRRGHEPDPDLDLRRDACRPQQSGADL